MLHCFVRNFGVQRRAIQSNEKQCKEKVGHMVKKTEITENETVENGSLSETEEAKSTSKKPVAKKATKKSTTKESTAKKSTAKKTTAKKTVTKSSTKKTTTKKTSTRKSAKANASVDTEAVESVEGEENTEKTVKENDKSTKTKRTVRTRATKTKTAEADSKKESTSKEETEEKNTESKKVENKDASTKTTRKRRTKKDVDAEAENATVKPSVNEEMQSKSISSDVETSTEKSADENRSSTDYDGVDREDDTDSNTNGEGADKSALNDKNTEARDEVQASPDAYVAETKNAKSKTAEKKPMKGKRKLRRRNQKKDPNHFISREELATFEPQDLLVRAQELQIDMQTIASMTSDEFTECLYQKSFEAQGCVNVSGVLDIMVDGYGFLRSSTYLPGENDTYVNASFIRHLGLRKGDFIEGVSRTARETEKFAPILHVDQVNGQSAKTAKERVKFSKLTPIYPDERFVLEHGKNTITARMIDLVSPIGKGQRGLIVSPPKAGKTTVLKDIAAAISANNPEVKLMCLLIDERPEEVTDMERSIKGEVISSTFDMPYEHHVTVAELVIERAKRLVELGHDVVILLDSLTRLARAYNLAQPASGRILSGGMDSTALFPPKKFLGAARNIEGGGSLTILASALIDTGSKMDEVIFEEFKGTGNMELKLDRYLADRRIYPAIDAVASGTRKEDLLLNPQEAPIVWAVRRLLANMNNTERATNMFIKSLRQTNSNVEFLLRAAKKAQAKGKLEEL